MPEERIAEDDWAGLTRVASAREIRNSSFGVRIPAVVVALFRMSGANFIRQVDPDQKRGGVVLFRIRIDTPCDHLRF